VVCGDITMVIGRGVRGVLRLERTPEGVRGAIRTAGLLRVDNRATPWLLHEVRVYTECIPPNKELNFLRRP
jgi:hypothetical protein